MSLSINGILAVYRYMSDGSFKLMVRCVREIELSFNKPIFLLVHPPAQFTATMPA
jgi:hypothetical protein